MTALTRELLCVTRYCELHSNDKIWPTRINELPLFLYQLTTFSPVRSKLAGRKLERRRQESNALALGRQSQWCCNRREVGILDYESPGPRESNNFSKI